MALQSNQPPYIAHSPAPVLLIGLDAADWGVIDPLLEAGRLPNLVRLIEGGWREALIASPPLLSPVVWTSIATGRRPHQHGIHGHFQPWRNGRGVSPVLAPARDAPALWDLLAGARPPRRTHVISWPVTHPAEAVAGIMVSDQFALSSAYGMTTIGLDADDDTVQPPHARAALAAIRRGPRDIDAALLRQFIPRFDEIDRACDNRPDTVAAALAEAETICAVAEQVMAHDPAWDLAAVHFPGIERLSRAFMEFHPPRRPHVDAENFDRYRNVVAAGYAHHDRLLGRLIERAGDGAAVVIVSDHGFHFGAGRPETSPAGARLSHEAMAATWHRPEGVVVLNRPVTLTGRAATVFDVTPTVLALLGVEAPPGLEGHSWVGARGASGSAPVSVEATSPLIPSRARLRSSRDWRGPAERASDAAIEHLLDLGYVEPPDEQANREVEYCRYVNALNLSRALLDAGEGVETIRLLESWRARRPKDPAVMRLLNQATARGGAGALAPP